LVLVIKLHKLIYSIALSDIFLLQIKYRRNAFSMNLQH